MQGYPPPALPPRPAVVPVCKDKVHKYWRLGAIIIALVAGLFFLILMGITVKASSKKDCKKSFKDCAKAQQKGGMTV